MAVKVNAEWLNLFLHVTTFLFHAAEDVGVVTDQGGHCLLPFSRQLVEQI